MARQLQEVGGSGMTESKLNVYRDAMGVLSEQHHIFGHLLSKIKAAYEEKLSLAFKEKFSSPSAYDLLRTELKDTQNTL